MANKNRIGERQIEKEKHLIGATKFLKLMNLEPVLCQI